MMYRRIFRIGSLSESIRHLGPRHPMLPVVRIALLWGPLLASLLVHAQPGTIDSLTRAYRGALLDTSALSTLNALNEALHKEGRCEETRVLAEEQIELAGRLAAVKGRPDRVARAADGYRASAHRLRGLCAMEAGDHRTALAELESALAIHRATGDQKGEAMALWYLGTVHLKNGDLDVALDYNLLALRARESLGDVLGLARSYNNIGYIHHEQGDHRKALEAHMKALELRRESGDKQALASSYNNLGMVHLALGEDRQAVEHYRMAHELAQELGDPMGTVRFHNNLGDIHERWGDHAKALEHYFQALATAEEIGDALSIGTVHLNIGNTLMTRGEVEEALVHFGRAMGPLERLGDRSRIALCLSAIGAANTARGLYDQALQDHLRALEIQREIGDKPRMARSLLRLGELHRTQRRHREALDLYRQGLRVNEEMADALLEADLRQGMGEVLETLGDASGARTAFEHALRSAGSAGYKKGIVAAHGALAAHHGRRGVFQQAYEHHVLFSAFKDSLFNEESDRRITDLKARYETAVKDQELRLKDSELELLDQERALQEARIGRQHATVRYLIAGFVLIVVFAIVVLRLAAQKRRAAFERRLLETEQKALRAQMNPHFIFNVLNSIQYYAGRNDMVAVETYLNKFTKLIRAILEQSRTPFIPLSQELEMLRLYLDLERMRFEDKFEHVIEVDPKIDTGRVHIPGMLVQPIVENAIKHGIRHKKGEALVKVSFLHEGDKLVCSVADNGVGRDAARRMNGDGRENGNGHQPVATAIIGERMDALGTLHGIQLACVTEDLTDAEGRPTGTRVTVEVPIHT